MSPAVFTLGYEGARQPDVIEALARAGVDLLIDVRAVPQSRKPGLSKRQLGASLAERGIGYLHLPGLGTPKAGRIAVRAGRVDEMRRIFADHMHGADARIDLDQAIDAARARRVCLLCFEHDPATCHRSLIAAMIARETGQRIENLFPPDQPCVERNGAAG